MASTYVLINMVSIFSARRYKNGFQPLIYLDFQHITHLFSISIIQFCIDKQAFAIFSNID